MSHRRSKSKDMWIHLIFYCYIFIFRCYPQQIEMQLSKVKSKIKTLRHIFSEYPSRAMQELAKTDRVIFHRVKEDMDKLEEKINLVKKKLDDLEKHQLTNHIFYVHLMAKYPLLLFDGLNIRNFKEMLDLTYSGIETLSNIFSEIEEGPPPTKKMRLDSMESLTMYFIDSYLTKWTIISNLISNVNLKIGERHIQLTRIHASQQDTDLHCPYIQYFLDTAQNARSSRDIVDERHWMIVAFLKSWKATNIFSY